LMSIVQSVDGFGEFATGDASGLIYTNGDNSATLNLQEKYLAVARNLDGALTQAHIVRSLLEISSPPDLSEVVAKLGETLGRLADLEFNAENAVQKIESVEGSAREQLALIETRAATSDEQSSAAQMKRAEVDEQARLILERSQGAEEQSTALLQKVEEINSRASELMAAVEAYKEAFSNFDEQLAKRQRLFQKSTDQISQLVTEFGEKRNFAQSVIDNAKEALGWGTVQSLTHSFSTSAHELDVPAQRATRMVYVSIVLLAVWVVLVFIIPARFDPSLKLFTVPGHMDGWAAILYVFGNLGVRLAVASPALLFVVFCLNRYRNLSSLREQYIFKKTVASAIPGFKEQAAAQDDPHAKAMTLAAFERLLFNPTELTTKDFGGRNGGGWLSRKLTDLVRRAMDEARS
ncbi:MAG: hypothetical protein RID07_11325, partial [Lacipirellulaceae bacterium]